MFSYGWKWQQALQKILKRLALNEGDGFLVLEGPDGSGKTHLINLAKEIVSKPSGTVALHNKEILALAELVHSRRFFVTDIGSEDVGFHNLSIPTLYYSGRKPLSATQRSKLLKSSVPIRTFADWKEDKPNFLEIDTLAHFRESLAVFYLNTLCAVDVATGWIEPIRRNTPHEANVLNHNIRFLAVKHSRVYNCLLENTFFRLLNLPRL